MRERLATEPWRTAFRASQWLLAALLMLPGFYAVPFGTIMYGAFCIPFAVTVLVGDRLWSAGRTGLVLAIGDLGALALVLIVLIAEPGTQLRAWLPGQNLTLTAVYALGIIGLVGSPAGPRRSSAGARPSIRDGALIVTVHAALIVFLLELLVARLTETDTHGYAGLVIGGVGGPILVLVLGLVAWWMGAWVPLVAVDALLVLWQAIRIEYVLSFLVPYGDWLTEGTKVLAWLLLAAIGGIAAFRLRPARSSRKPEVRL